MRTFLAAFVAASLASGAFGQTTGQDNTIPREIGNRANGFSYQPRPNQVDPREVSAGVRPSPATQNATDHVLGGLDTKLLKEEGLGASSVPNFAQQHSGQASGESTR